MTTAEFEPQRLPASTRSLASGVPKAPRGTIFALAADGGYAVPPGEFTLSFGRDKDDVHVPIGLNDAYVSRWHGIFKCHGHEWWLHNRGNLPIRLPGDGMLLCGNALLMEPGYTPLFIGSPKRRSHLLEIHVVGPPADIDGEQHSRTKAPDVYELNPVERLVLTALAQRYLRQERYPQPLSWKQVADELNLLPDGREWTSKAVAHVVALVRERLAAGADPVPGLRREDGVAEPVGNTLNHNLIQVLLLSATLMPSDLFLLGESCGPLEW